MFTADDILARTRRQPFEPFRIVTSTGQAYDVLHPDMALATRRYVMLSIPTLGGLPDRHTEVAIIHITELQNLPYPAPSGTNGPAG